LEELNKFPAVRLSRVKVEFMEYTSGNGKKNIYLQLLPKEGSFQTGYLI